MIVSIETARGIFRVDTADPIDISIPLNFGGPQPNAYGVERASAEPCRAGELVGDTRQGGSCNFEKVTLIPHCNGTHTECVGHITNERIGVTSSVNEAFVPAVVVTAAPELARVTNDTYAVVYGEEDTVITARALRDAIAAVSADILSVPALVVRTLPNDEEKKWREYGDSVPPYFSTEAIEYIVSLGVRHLLVDLPSIDRLFDEGKLSNHRNFWGVEAGSFDAGETARRANSITELIYVPDEAEDGEYLLNLQIAPFAADAAPSRPMLFRPVKDLPA